VGRAAALLTDVLNPEVIVVTESASLLNAEYLAVMGAELAERSHVCEDPGRLVGPHAGPAVLPVAGGTPVLAALYRSPLQVTPDALSDMAPETASDSDRC
jgi:hypothetical protein